VLARDEVLTPEYLPDVIFREGESTAVPPNSLEEVERDHIQHVLEESPTLEDAAETLGINVSTLWRKRKRYKID
jgi:transcriptional regulator with PAS, ATPase and Fis domain